MHTLTVKGLAFDGRHGVHEFEKQEGNRFEVDLIFKADLSKAAKSDKLADTIDYSKAQQIVSNIFAGEPVNLIETLAQNIGVALMETFQQVQKLEVTVRKLTPLMDVIPRYVEISMTWQR